MAKPKSKNKEDIAAKKREREKQRYQKNKNNPELYAEYQRKNKLKYEKRKEQKKIVPINEMTSRQQRIQRKKWREERKRRYQRMKDKKAKEKQFIAENSPPESDAEVAQLVNAPEGNAEVNILNVQPGGPRSLRSQPLTLSPSSSRISSACSSGTVSPKAQRIIRKLSKMTELDKFKRRTIRSVARLLLREKKPPEELWAEMKKETGTDCRVLWERMRALCVKKLNRMIAADDRSANLPTIARLSLTDWLLVDLVLVHEEVDVIAMDKNENKDFPALIELFNLVQRFDVEGRRGEALAEAWAAATVFYNRQGRQCSPMLLQRRWYQLKKLTRCRFYKFWFSYRGNTRLLEEARKSMPTRLQMAIAKRYPRMITAEFPDWDDMVKDGCVIMPEEFEAKMRMPNLPKPCSSDAPDLVLVEPVIETIDLRVESDHEGLDEDEIEDTSDPERSNDATDITSPTPDFTSEEQNIATNETVIAPVKTEPIEEDGLSNVQLISATHVPEVEIPDESPDGSPKIVPPSQGDSAIIEEKQIDKNPDDDDLIEIPSITPTGNVDLATSTGDIVQTVAAEVSPNDLLCDEDTIINDSDEGVEDIIKLKADEYCYKATKETPSKNYNTIDDLIKDKVDTFLKTPKVKLSFKEKEPDTINIVNKADVSAIDLMADLNFVDDGIEFVDDGVEFVEEDVTKKAESAGNSSQLDRTEQTGEASNKFDLKLLMYPVVYTTKLDQMKIFENKSYESVENNSDIEMAIVESKPISTQSFNMKIKRESVTSMNEDTTDNDDLFTNREETDDEEIEEDEKVSPNSYLLKKPRTRTYDLIKLCKNPDFNTKLKRVTIGFLSSTRNRQLLNACIPMTIDLSKAFESKLVNRTLYLKSSGTTPNIEKQEVIDDKQASSIVPTAMSLQSLIDNSKVDIRNLIPHQLPPETEPIISERTKVINLPDIDKIRKINQKLLTAQVPPLRVTACSVSNERTPSSYSANEAEAVEKSTPDVNPTVSSNVPTVPNMHSIGPVSSLQNNLPNKVKVENEKSAHSNDISDTTDIITPPETLPPAKEKLVKMINLAKISTQEALAKIDDGTKQSDFPMPIQVKEVKANLPYDVPASKKSYSYQPRVPLAWAPKFAQPPKNLDNFGLLTADTLNKMLHLLMSGNPDGSGCSCCVTKSKAKKIKRKGRQEAKQKELESKTSKNEEKNLVPAEEEDALPKNSSPPPLNAQDAPKDTDQEKTKNTKLVVLGRVVKYCCWAKQKICNRKRMTRHECLPNACTCCCVDELVEKIMKDDEKKKKEMEIRANKDQPIELSDDDEKSLRRACESIETVVQQSRDISTTHFGQVETSTVHTMVINPITSTSVTASASSPGKVSVTVKVIPSDLQSDVSITSPERPFIQTVRAAPVASLMPKRPPVPRIQINPKPRRGRPTHWSPCTCQKPAVSQDSRCNIVIDASVMKCARHPILYAPTSPVAATTPIISTPPIVPVVPIAPKTPAQKQEKILYLHSKSLAKSPSESPIFLGKNKILLTTVKFPRKTENVAPATEVIQAPKIIPTLPLPAGVQLVLIPSGEVTYTLDPGVELDEAQLAALPTILAAVQEQLNSSGISSATMAQPQSNTTGDIPPVAVAQPESTNMSPSGEASETPPTDGNISAQTEDPSSVTLQADDVFQDTEQKQKNTNIVDMEVETDNVNADPSTQQGAVACDPDNVSTPLTEDTANKLTIDPIVLSNPTTVAGSSQVNETQSVMERAEESNVNEAVNNRKSLLSDLMEMSGISAEDAVAPEPTVLVQPPLTTLQNTANVSVSNELRNLPELSPVTSFAELKYACEENGKFFKLDFETGVIVPINVCIKKNPKNKPVNIGPKECIDLTDDAESSDVVITKKQEAPAKPQFKGPVEYSYNGKTVSVSDPVKPVKLFKAFRPTATPTVLKLKRLTRVQATKTLLNNKQTHIEKRKARVEARIDLVDSDEEPMEEEYLLDSSDDDSISAVDPMQIEALDPSTQSDDSSDDEPLAKKSRRLKEGEPENEKRVREFNIYDELPEPTVINNDFSVPDSNELPLGVREDLSGIPPPDYSGSNLTMPKDRSSVAPSGANQVSPSRMKNIMSSVVVTSDGPPPSTVGEGILAAPPDEEGSEDERSDKASKKFMDIRFMSDPSDGEEAEDCILGV